MKKIFFLSLLILFILIGLFFLFGGRDRVNQILNPDPDFGTFFDIPNGSQNQSFENNQDIPDTTITPTEPYKAPLLRQISFEPVSGFTFYPITIKEEVSVVNEEMEQVLEEIDVTTTVFRFQERATGHLYEVFEFLPQAELLSNITIPQIYKTIFTNNPDIFIFQTLDPNHEQIISKRGEFVLTTNENQEVTGIDIEQSTFSGSITDLTYNKFSENFIYSIKENSTSRITTSNSQRTDEEPLTTLSFNQFLIDPISATEALITTKPSHNTQGHAYLLNLTNGALSRLMGGTNGLLVKTNSDKSIVLSNQTIQSRPVLQIRSGSGLSGLLFIDTLPEKCVFSKNKQSTVYCFGGSNYPQAQYPDDWYKGKVFTTDSLYKIDTETFAVEPVLIFDSFTEDLFDVIHPQITDNDSHIVFQNKRDLTLWAIDLTQLEQENL